MFHIVCGLSDWITCELANPPAAGLSTEYMVALGKLRDALDEMKAFLPICG